MKLVADNVQTVVIPGAGHWVAEQAPEQELAALAAFLEPYRTSVGSSCDAAEPWGVTFSGLRTGSDQGHTRVSPWLDAAAESLASA